MINYTIGLDSATIQALGGLGNFGVEKIGELYAKSAAYLSVYYGAMFWVCLVLAALSLVVWVVLLVSIRDDDELVGFMAGLIFLVFCLLSVLTVDTAIRKSTTDYQAIQHTISMIKGLK